MSVFREENGKSSSKRVMGIVILFSMVFLYCIKEWRDEEIQSPEVFISFLLTAGTLLGISVLKNFGKDGIKKGIGGELPKNDDEGNG